MTGSQGLWELAVALGTLRRTFLPDPFDPTGSYPNSEQVKLFALAYRVLAHAEIESFLEGRVVELAKASWTQWEVHGIPTRTALALLAFSGRQHDVPPSTVTPPQPSQIKIWPEKISADERLNAATSNFIRMVVKENHGIREANVLSLLLPVGTKASDLDVSWLASLDAYAASRGEAAHKGAAHLLSVDPESEWQKVREVFEIIASIDALLESL